MNKLNTKQKTIVFTSTFVIGLLMIGGFALYKILPKMPTKEYTAACLYLAVMDDEIARNELEGNTINGEEIVFPSKKESLQYKYHLLLKMNKKMTTPEMDAEIEKFETRLEDSKQYIGLPKQELELE